jgi:agmatine deiminase
VTAYVPPEWSAHQAMWVGFPSHPELWQEDLEEAQEEVAALARALAGPGGERVRLLCHGAGARRAATRLLEGVERVELVDGRFGDIWLRDTGPIFLGSSPRRAIGFRFNGWGRKYVLPFDDEVAEQLARASGVALHRHDFVMEGGALDHDGDGTILTTRQCLLNDNRNAGWDEAAAAAALDRALGARKVLWLDEGLVNDHTDGHVDNLARFLAPGVVACPAPSGADDPNRAIYIAAREALSGMRDAAGRALAIVDVPSPGLVDNDDGEPVPASHMNFIIANRAVVVPHYGNGEAAGAAIARALPGRELVLLPSRALLSGGGSFHCISQQEPACPAP